MCHSVGEEVWTMVYALVVTTGLLALLPIITCAAVDPFAFEVPLDPDGIQRAVVEADSYEFSPRHLVVRAGKPVELTVKSVTVVVPRVLAFVRPAAGQEHESPFFLAKLPLQDLPCRLVHDEPVGGHPAGHDGLSKPPVGFEHGMVRIAGDGMDRKADASRLA